MRTAGPSQDAGAIWWTPVNSHGWLTECTPLEIEPVIIDSVDWPPWERTTTEPMDEKDQEERAWAAASRRTLIRWMRENPF